MLRKWTTIYTAYTPPISILYYLYSSYQHNTSILLLSAFYIIYIHLINILYITSYHLIVFWKEVHKNYTIPPYLYICSLLPVVSLYLKYTAHSNKRWAQSCLIIRFKTLECIIPFWKSVFSPHKSGILERKFCWPFIYRNTELVF